MDFRPTEPLHHQNALPRDLGVSIFLIHLHTFLFDPFRFKAFILKPGHSDRHSSSAGYVVASSSVFVVCSWHAVAVYLVIQPNCTFS